MALGAATVAFIVTIQNDPLAFSSHRPNPIAIATLETLPVPNVMAIELAILAQTALIQMEEVTVAGRMSRPPATSPGTETTVHQLLLPAPCRDGEYRLLDEKRGVRL